LSLSKEIGASDLLAAIYASLGRFKYSLGEVELGMQYVRKSLEIVNQGGAEANTIAHIFNQIGGLCIEEKPHITTQFLGFGESIWRRECLNKWVNEVDEMESIVWKLTAFELALVVAINE